MERNNWNYRDRDFRNSQDRYEDRREAYQRNNDRRADPDTYRGAYRLDTTSDHRHVSTWDGFDRDSDNNWQRNDRRSQNQYQDRNSQYGDRDSRYQPYGDEAYERHRQDRYDRPERSSNYRHRDYGPASNFNSDYSPDNYPHRRDENYGNMAGSLSFGYDGDRNSDPDADRYYDPLSGHLRGNRHSSQDQHRHRSNRSDNNWHDERY